MMVFGGESYLQVQLPDYSQECSILTFWLLLASLFWFVVYPVLVSREIVVELPPTTTPARTTFSGKDRNNKTIDVNPKEPKLSKTSMYGVKTNVSKVGAKPLSKTKTTGTTTISTYRQVPILANVMGLLGAMITVVTLILYGSPYNYYAPRRVFVFPLFTPTECQAIITMAEHAASKNYQQAQTWAKSLPNGTNLSPDPNMVEADTMEQTYRTMLQPPLGWHKLRHGNYPTTDLNLVTDPFTAENRTYLTELFDKRLAPTLERIYGIPQRAFRAIDMFVVRYDEGIRTHLENHTDDGDVSFTILLNDAFEGGGTQFWRRTHNNNFFDSEIPFAHVQPTQVGTVVTNHALINHEGYRVSKGTRIILVGFTNVDRLDPWTGEPTGLGWSFASWLNLAWLNVKFKTGYYNGLERLERHHGQVTKWFDSSMARLLFRDLTNLMEYLGDMISPHQVEYLVSPDQASDYLRALDRVYEEQQVQQQAEGTRTTTSRSIWWKGQMVNLDFVSS